jgi:hypothetical protein
MSRKATAIITRVLIVLIIITIVVLEKLIKDGVIF